MRAESVARLAAPLGIGEVVEEHLGVGVAEPERLEARPCLVRGHRMAPATAHRRRLLRSESYPSARAYPSIGRGSSTKRLLTVRKTQTGRVKDEFGIQSAEATTNASINRHRCRRGSGTRNRGRRGSPRSPRRRQRHNRHVLAPPRSGRNAHLHRRRTTRTRSRTAATPARSTSPIRTAISTGRSTIQARTVLNTTDGARLRRGRRSGSRTTTAVRTAAFAGTLDANGKLVGFVHGSRQPASRARCSAA